MIATSTHIYVRTRIIARLQTHVRMYVPTYEKSLIREESSLGNRKQTVIALSLLLPLVKIVSEEQPIKETLAPVSVPGPPRAYQRSRWPIGTGGCV